MALIPVSQLIEEVRQLRKDVAGLKNAHAGESRVLTALYHQHRERLIALERAVGITPPAE